MRMAGRLPESEWLSGNCFADALRIAVFFYRDLFPRCGSVGALADAIREGQTFPAVWVLPEVVFREVGDRYSFVWFGH